MFSARMAIEHSGHKKFEVKCLTLRTKQMQGWGAYQKVVCLPHSKRHYLNKIGRWVWEIWESPQFPPWWSSQQQSQIWICRSWRCQWCQKRKGGDAQKDQFRVVWCLKSRPGQALPFGGLPWRDSKSSMTSTTLLSVAMPLWCLQTTQPV